MGAEYCVCYRAKEQNNQNIVTDEYRTSVTEKKQTVSLKNKVMSMRLVNTPKTDLKFRRFVRSEDQIEKDYQYSVVLGSGKYGTVYTCTRKNTKQEFALKVIKKETDNDDDAKKRLEQEFEVLKTLDHPNIARVHDLIEDNKNYYIVSEIVKSGNLMELLENLMEREEMLELEDVARIIKQLLLAINHMHQQGIAHRDIKLDNILMDEEGRVKLIDFGFALYTHDKKLSDHIGTPLYKAPEIVNGEEYGISVDIWAIGIVTMLLTCG